MSATLFCAIWDVSEENMENYWQMLLGRAMLIVVLMVVVPLMIPRNEAIHELADKFREDYAA